MIELTERQRHEIGDSIGPVAVIDPITKREFYLLRAEVFARWQAALPDFDQRDTYPALDRTFAPGWDAPNMSEYDQYEQHRPCLRLPQ